MSDSFVFLISIFIVGFFYCVVWLIGFYNKAVSQLEETKKYQSNLDAEVKRKVDLVYQLADSIKDGSEFEKNLYKMLSEIRSDTIDDSSEIELKINKVIAYAEAFPNIRSIDLFESFQVQVGDTETRIQKAKMLFNHSAFEYNAFIKIFPNVLGALLLGFKGVLYQAN